MKLKYIGLIFSLLTTIQTITAQRTLYGDVLPIVSDTISMNGYTYVCDTVGTFIINLHNIENHPGRGEVAYADGTPIPLYDALHNTLKHVELPSDVIQKLRTIVDTAFSAEQAQQLAQDERFCIMLNISSADGAITDVYFEFDIDQHYAQIPLDVFRDIELRLKNEVIFELTEEGRKMNYCFLSWMQVPQGRIEVTPTIPDVNNGGIGGGGFTGNPIGNNTNIITSAGGR
ncbi:MAG: DUF5043 domain-containing protein [Rikenellaceae bacterium]|nr:DUF5043 domain-containing protein [Rikenellaceae bacterium]